jgi:predicted MPP superfamily phosphohydrolase
MHWLLSGPLTTERLTVRIRDLPPSLQGKKLVQLSDFHYDGLRLSEAMLQKAIAITNEVQPDLILLTGDYVTDEPAPIHQLVIRLKGLQSRCGVYAVLGNHDFPCKAEVTDALTGIGVRVLRNEIVYPLGKGLPLVGLGDYRPREFKPAVINELDPATPRLVLSHNPDTAEVLQAWRVDLQLSGHTHGGQIVIPGIGPLIYYYTKIMQKIPRKLRRRLPFLQKEKSLPRHWEWSQGLHRIGKNQLYINRGLGTYCPGRLFCPPEVTIITLEGE